MKGATMPRLKLPPDYMAIAEVALERLRMFPAVCFWCGVGYKRFSLALEDVHLAYVCPGAPRELRQAAKVSLGKTWFGLDPTLTHVYCCLEDQ
jgi:hypothetical protein